MDWLSLVDAIASIATALGVGFTGYQIKMAKQAAKSEFEDSLMQQYREIIKRIPIEALLGKDLKAINAQKWEDTLDDFYRYIDLSNEQVFLRQNNRVSEATWQSWCEGIESNLKLQSFKDAWNYFKKEAPEYFKELQLLELKDFKDDPHRWDKNWGQKLNVLQEKSAKLLDK
jgi:hypothetical protein